MNAPITWIESIEARFSHDLASSAKTARLWSAETGAALGPGIDLRHEARFMPTGGALAIGGNEPAVRILSVAEADRPTRASPPAPLGSQRPPGKITAASTVDLDINSKGRVIAARSDGSLIEWDVEREQEVHGFSLGFTPALVRCIPGSERVVVLADSPGEAFLCDPGLYQTQRLTWNGTAAHAGVITSVSVSPDGELLLTTSEDSTARVWPTRTGAPVFTFAKHSGPVLAGTISHDGTFAVTVSSDGTARTWPLDLQRAAQERIPRRLTSEELEDLVRR